MIRIFKRKIYSLLILIPFLWTLSGCGSGGSSSGNQNSNPDFKATGPVVLSWETPTSDTDGMPLADLAGYYVYYGSSSQSYAERIDVGKVTTYAIHNLSPGTYYFAVAAYDASGNETEYSNEVAKKVP
jgi:uncharacterized protein YfaP (DUF2135 family)